MPRAAAQRAKPHVKKRIDTDNLNAIRSTQATRNFDTVKVRFRLFPSILDLLDSRPEHVRFRETAMAARQADTEARECSASLT